ncbi:hypothetical protein ACFYMX_04110 [Streptomyces griseofuscus]|uniref:hypothetical protein n=1 Tax=Streptomyces griseofuscus TaxID=146922 RepID=UPI0036C62A5D
MSRKAALYDAIEHAHPGRMPVGHGSAAWRSKGLVPLSPALGSPVVTASAHTTVSPQKAADHE